MNISWQDILQDTLKLKSTVPQDTVRSGRDSVSIIKTRPVKVSSVHGLTSPADSIPMKPADTTSICPRNNVIDVTFYDSTNFILNPGHDTIVQYPFLIINKERKKESEIRQNLMTHLKSGQELPGQVFQNDWTIGIIITAAFLYSVIRNTSKKMLPDFARFFLFRGINDPISRDMGGLFHWQSTILNLVSFLILSLFVYISASNYGMIPTGINGIIFWLICLGVIITAVTIRHVVCLITGIISGEEEIFRDYLLGVYQSYRFSSLLLFVVIVLTMYTTILPEKISLISGITVFGLMYLIRIIRLMIIFLKRNISIFYLILYLCALEFLPVVITVKYFTGLV